MDNLVCRSKRGDFLQDAMAVMQFEIPESVFIDKEPSYWKAMFRGYDLQLRDDIKAWCVENNIKYGRIRPHSMMAVSRELTGRRVHLFEPYCITIRDDTKAVLFKMMWC
jgi:hypothetical protein